MTRFRTLLLTFLAVLLISLVCTVIFQAFLALGEKQDQARNNMYAQARDIATLYEGVRDRSVTPAVFHNFAGRIIWEGGNIWLVNDLGLIFDAWDKSVGVLHAEHLEEYLLPAMQGEEMLVSGIFGDEITTAVVPVKLNEKISGALMLHMPVQDLNLTDPSLWRPTTIAALFGGTLGAVLLVLAAYTLAKPVRKLAEDGQKLANQEIMQITTDQRDELLTITRTMNEMARRLQSMGGIRKDFVSNVSHELRSPLTSMQGYLQAMVDGAVPVGEKDHYIEVVLDETRRLSRLVEDLLRLSRMESGGEELSMESFDINELLRRSLAAFSRRLEDQGIDVHLDFQEPCMVLGNSAMIRQVVDNLIDNAIKYMGNGRNLGIRTKGRGEQVFVTISDDGQGIALEDIPHVFERFYKADKAHSTPGSGLGLAIVQGILERHGQAIRASSVAGKGTAMVFTLQRAMAGALK